MTPPCYNQREVKMNTIKVQCDRCGEETMFSSESGYLPDFVAQMSGWLHHEYGSLTCPNPDCHQGYSHRFQPVNEDWVNQFAITVGDWRWQVSPELSKVVAERNAELDEADRLIDETELEDDGLVDWSKLESGNG
jgi:hypothetical protein